MSMENKYMLDPHSEAILEEYREQLPVFRKMQETIPAQIRAVFEETGIVVASIESRIKEERSLAGKLELKGAKYQSLSDITDIFGIRIITFYTDDVDKVASVVDRLFEVDWENSVDKRKLHEIDSFGYLSLHYICHVPDIPYAFEVQMRTILQHAWANMNHDIGYKTGVEVPKEYLRNMNRLAGMLELWTSSSAPFAGISTITAARSSRWSPPAVWKRSPWMRTVSAVSSTWDLSMA